MAWDTMNAFLAREENLRHTIAQLQSQNQQLCFFWQQTVTNWQLCYQVALRDHERLCIELSKERAKWENEMYKFGQIQNELDQVKQDFLALRSKVDGINKVQEGRSIESENSLV